MGFSATFGCLEVVSAMHVGLMSSFKISRLLAEAMHWSLVVIYRKDEREKG